MPYTSLLRSSFMQICTRGVCSSLLTNEYGGMPYSSQTEAQSGPLQGSTWIRLGSTWVPLGFHLGSTWIPPGAIVGEVALSMTERVLSEVAQFARGARY